MAARASRCLLKIIIYWICHSHYTYKFTVAFTTWTIPAQDQTREYEWRSSSWSSILQVKSFGNWWVLREGKWVWYSKIYDLPHTHMIFHMHLGSTKRNLWVYRHYRIPRLIKMYCFTSPNQWIHSTKLILSTGKIQKNWKDCKSQKISECVVRLCLLVMSEFIPLTSYQ